MSPKIVVGLDGGRPNLVSRQCSQIASCVAALSTITLASMLNSATNGCFWTDQLIEVLPIRKTYPEIDFWSSGLLPQSASK